MRDILFRGKCVKDSKYAGEWVEGGCVLPDEDSKEKNESLIIVYFGGNSTSTYHVESDTVGQYIGLIDKNGTKIFEGDIIRSFDSQKKPILHKIEYDAFRAGYVAILIDNYAWHSNIDQNWIFEFDKCVIGNIYDNDINKIKEEVYNA